MALRFTLSHQVARLLSCCPSSVRERVLRELSRTLVEPSFGVRPAPRSGLEVGVLRLPSGFQVGYRLDRARQRVEMLDLAGPGSFASASPAH